MKEKSIIVEALCYQNPFLTVDPAEQRREDEAKEASRIAWLVETKIAKLGPPTKNERWKSILARLVTKGDIEVFGDEDNAGKEFPWCCDQEAEGVWDLRDDMLEIFQ